MELTKQTDLIDKISAQYKPYIEALRTPTIKDTNRVDCLKHIYASLQLSMSYQSQEDNGAAKFISEQFYDQALIKYPFARLGEITNAFKKGALKEYGDYFGINVQTVWNWFKKYQESPDLLAAKREWVNLIEMPKHDEENKPLNLNESLREPILNAYKEWLDTGKLPFTASSFYSVICQLKGVKTLINDQETRERIRQEAYNNYRESEVKKGTNRKSPELFENLLKWCLTKGMNPSYETETRRVALKEYFNYCKINNKEII